MKFGCGEQTAATDRRIAHVCRGRHTSSTKPGNCPSCKAKMDKLRNAYACTGCKASSSKPGACRTAA